MSNAVQAILNNPMLKKLLFKQLIAAMKDNNIELLCITLDKKEEIQVKEYTEQMTIIKTKEWNDFLAKALNKNNKPHE